VETPAEQGWPKADPGFQQVSYDVPRVPVPTVPDAEYVNDDELCLTCHQTYTESFAHNVHRVVPGESKCEACHGPASRHLETRGKEPGLILSFKTMAPAERSEVCLQCHEEYCCSPGAQWRTSKHGCAGLSCTDCHDGHYNVPPGTPATTDPTITQDRAHMPAVLVSYLQEEGLPSLAGSSNNLNAEAPGTCYQCHGDKVSMSQIAGPHQICGPNNFNCTTCHDPHGNLLEYSRKELCLQCHEQGSPTMAWHSSTHELNGVACTDCHNPHPEAAVARDPRAAYTSLLHTNVNQPARRPMGVDEPGACYKCHENIFAQTRLPSHHPILEGKMVCSDCHDAHGQLEGNLKAEHINVLCWKCHADKQGPFAYEHPPVTENCGYCHAPHGTVANNLLKQPTTFLCLRCHVGHRDGDHGGGDRVNIDINPQLRPGFYTDCTTCHSQIHGSDLPTPHFPGMFR
jgi:DmsE family decaheme c-type cytochrome